jgi:hypothetical protein
MAERKHSGLSGRQEQPGEIVASLSYEDSLRIASAHELLARACFDIGIKAEGSAKLTRALEDVAQARDALWQITLKFPRFPIASDSVLHALHVDHLDGLCFSAARGAAANWARWREQERSRHQDDRARSDDRDDDWPAT